MTDVVDSATRSRMMSGIRGKDTRPERIVRSYLHREGFRFRLHVRDLPGRPDIVLPCHRAVVFVHGCFWHAHAGCRYAARPATRREFWERKLASNRERDTRALGRLMELGWRTFIVWECSLRHDHTRSLAKLAQMIRSNTNFLEIPSRPYKTS